MARCSVVQTVWGSTAYGRNYNWFLENENDNDKKNLIIEKKTYIWGYSIKRIRIYVLESRFTKKCIPLMNLSPDSDLMNPAWILFP